jgi:PAS domain S-box-containing protein
MSELDELTSNLLFAGFTAMVASYFVLRQQQLLYQGMLTEAIERKRAEERQQMLVERTRELEHLTQQLEFQVAERQQAEAALRQSEARFKAFMDHSPLVAFIKDDQGYYIYGNRAWAEQFDQPLVELLGKTDADLWPPPVVKDFTKSDAVTQATGSNSEVITLTSLLTTTPRYWTVFKFSITDHLNRQLIGGICLDVTEQKLTSAALQASEERFRQAIASISDHLYVARITPLGWQNEFVSPQVEVLSGYPVESYSGGSNFWLDEVVHPEDRARLLAVQQRWFATGTGGEIEYRLIRADGQLVWVRDSVRVVDTSEGKKIYGVIGNITERKKLEEQLRQAQKMEAIGKLAGGVAHDFNNLLTVINGYTDLLLQHQDREANLAYKDIEQIKKAGERAATLTKQLLAFSRQQILQLQILDLNTVVMDLDNMLRRLIGEDVELVPRLQLDLGRVKADRGQIEQVILNLVLNARDAMPQGGHLTIETANTSPQQLVDLWPLEVMSDAYIMLAVTDTGHGIAPDILPHIFEPFFTTKEVGKGTGLGLATVYGIVTQSGGHVRVWSALGQGSCFKVYLPRIEIQAEATVIERDKTWLLQGVETVLVVEDEANVRALVSNILTKHGYTVLEAQNGHQALQRSQSYSAPIHLLLTDVVMPGMGGQELAERLVSLLPELRVLYMSGYADHPLNRNGQNSDHQLLLKPFSPEGLMRSVRRVLDGKLD